MKRFTHSVPYNGIMWGMSVFECKVCGKQIICNARCQPNDIEIGGEAVALSCKN